MKEHVWYEHSSPWKQTDDKKRETQPLNTLCITAKFLRILIKTLLSNNQVTKYLKLMKNFKQSLFISKYIFLTKTALYALILCTILRPLQVNLRQKNPWDARWDASDIKWGRFISPDAPCVRIIPYAMFLLGTKQTASSNLFPKGIFNLT